MSGLNLGEELRWEWKCGTLTCRATLSQLQLGPQGQG